MEFSHKKSTRNPVGVSAVLSIHHNHQYTDLPEHPHSDRLNTSFKTVFGIGLAIALVLVILLGFPGSNRAAVAASVSAQEVTIGGQSETDPLKITVFADGSMELMAWSASAGDHLASGGTSSREAVYVPCQTAISRQNQRTVMHGVAVLNDSGSQTVAYSSPYFYEYFSDSLGADLLFDDLILLSDPAAIEASAAAVGVVEHALVSTPADPLQQVRTTWDLGAAVPADGLAAAPVQLTQVVTYRPGSWSCQTTYTLSNSRIPSAGESDTPLNLRLLLYSDTCFTEDDMADSAWSSSTLAASQLFSPNDRQATMIWDVDGGPSLPAGVDTLTYAFTDFWDMLEQHYSDGIRPFASFSRFRPYTENLDRPETPGTPGRLNFSVDASTTNSAMNVLWDLQPLAAGSALSFSIEKMILLPAAEIQPTQPDGQTETVVTPDGEAETEESTANATSAVEPVSSADETAAGTVAASQTGTAVNPQTDPSVEVNATTVIQTGRESVSVGATAQADDTALVRTGETAGNTCRPFIGLILIFLAGGLLIWRRLRCYQEITGSFLTSSRHPPF